MRLLLDSQILRAIALKRLDIVSPTVARTIARPEMDLVASAARLWEIAIKTRLGKLDPGMPIAMLAEFLDAVGIGMLPIRVLHAVASVDPLPPRATRSTECSWRGASSRIGASSRWIMPSAIIPLRPPSRI